MFQLRLIKSEDLPHINTLFTETVHTVNVHDYSPEQLEIWAPRDRSHERWERALQGHIVYIAELDNMIIGFGDITREGLIDHLFVHKDFQGKGIASALLAQLEKEARALGIKELWTEASITARPFFEKRGFCVQKQQEKLYNGLVFINYLMNKKLIMGHF